MMRPHLRCFMPGSAARVEWKADDRLMAMIASHFATGNSSIGATNWMPALLTTMSTLPKVFSAFCTMPATASPLAHVGAVIDDLDLVLVGELAANFLDLLGIAEAVEHDVGAGLRERLGDAEADAARRAGDDGGFASECAHACRRPSCVCVAIECAPRSIAMKVVGCAGCGARLGYLMSRGQITATIKICEDCGGPGAAGYRLMTVAEALHLVFLAAVALAFGSFVGVLVRRLPAGATILGRSRCNSCGVHARGARHGAARKLCLASRPLPAVRRGARPDPSRGRAGRARPRALGAGAPPRAGCCGRAAASPGRCWRSR